MSARESDWNYMGELAVQRRQLKAELRAHRLRVIAKCLDDGCETRDIAERLGVSTSVVNDLVAVLKGAKS